MKKISKKTNNSIPAEVVKNDHPYSRYASSVLLLILLAFCLPTTERLFRVYLTGDATPKLSCHFQIDGAKTKWWYARYIVNRKDPFNFMGLSYLEQTFEDVREPFLDHNINGGPLNINHYPFSKGIGTHAPSKIAFDLQGNYNRFSCKAGFDQNSGPNHGVMFIVFADGKEIYRSPKVEQDADPLPIDCSVMGVRELVLLAQSATNDVEDNVDWVDLKFTLPSKTTEIHPTPIK